MKQISSLDLYFLTLEFKEILENSRIDSFYAENGYFWIKFYVKSKGAMFLENNISKSIFITNSKTNSSGLPNSFIGHLRKYLKNGILQKIDVIENERILKLEISKKSQDSDEITIYYLLIELFANGNIILTDSELRITNSLIKKNYKDRKVKVKEIYEFPPKIEFNILNLNKSDFEISIKKTDLSIVKFIAIKFGIGGKYAEEIVYLAGFDKNKNIAKLNKNEINKLEQIIINFVKQKIEPKMILNDKDEFINFIPFKFKSLNLEILKMKSYENYNACVKDYFEQFVEEVDQREKNFQNELARFEKRLKLQIKQKNKILKDYEIANNNGTLIYENYTMIDELLNLINNTAKEKGWDYVLDKIKSSDKLSKIIKKLNYKNNEIILDL